MSKIAIIGAGASGLMVSGLLAKKGHDVYVLEKNEKVGKKLYITGKGRCNLTNLCLPDEFIKNVVRGEKFMTSAIYSFSSEDCIKFFEGLGLKTKVERGNRVFPESDKSSDVIKILKENHCKDVRFLFKCEVLSITKQNDKFLLNTNTGKMEFDNVIIATGGKSYKSTGSDGAGFKFAKMLGHTVETLVPALCPLILTDEFVKDLQGVSLKNVQLNVISDGKKFGLFGEMLFTDKGISGPVVLTVSSLINRAKDVKLSLDFKPALTQEQLEQRILRDFESSKNKNLKFVLNGLLPKTVAKVFADVVGVNADKKVHDITKSERKIIVENLKNFKLNYGGLYDIDTGIVTSGGVCLKEINPKTFESKLVSGVYFLGEVLDVDALTGGFNLQCCWSSAYACAENFV